MKLGKGKYQHLHCSIWSSWNFVVRSIFSFLWNENAIEIKTGTGNKPQFKADFEMQALG